MRLKTGLLLIIIGLILAACTQEAQTKSYIGYVEAEYIYIAAPQSGWLTLLSVTQGDEVAEGDTLFTLDDTQQKAALASASARVSEARAQAKDMRTGARPAEIRALEAQLTEAEATLEKARADRDRFMPLVAEGIEAKTRGDQLQADYRAALARVKAAEEAIEVAALAGRDAAQEAAAAAIVAARANEAEARWRLDERSVTAGQDGRIETIFHRQGEFINAGTPVLALLPETGLKIRFFVPQSALPQVRLGQQITLYTDGETEGQAAVISFVSDAAEFTPPVIYSKDAREKLVFMIEASLPATTSLRPGLPVDVVLS